MITCRELAESLFDLTSGELAAAHREQVEDHVRLCPSCLAYQESYRVTIQLARQLVHQPLPPELARRLQGLLESEAI